GQVQGPTAYARERQLGERLPPHLSIAELAPIGDEHVGQTVDRSRQSECADGEDDEDDEERGNDDVEQLLEAVLQSPIDDEPDEADGDVIAQYGLELDRDVVLPHLPRIRPRGEPAGELEHEVAQSPTGDHRIVAGASETDEADDAADPGESAPHEVAEGADG